MSWSLRDFTGSPSVEGFPTSALCRFCCKSRKSNEPENLAKGDFQRAVTLRSPIPPLRGSVVVFPRNHVVPHVLTRETHQHSRNFVRHPKRPFSTVSCKADIGEITTFARCKKRLNRIHSFTSSVSEQSTDGGLSKPTGRRRCGEGPAICRFDCIGRRGSDG